MGDMKSVIHYKFKSARDNLKVEIDGTKITCAELKPFIIKGMKMKEGANTDTFDLDLTNAETKEAYSNEDMVPGNTSVVVVRVPVVKRRKRKTLEEIEQERLALVQEYKKRKVATDCKVNEAKPVTDPSVRPTQLSEVGWEELKELLPIEVICPICKHIIKDAVCCACCGSSACGECKYIVMKTVLFYLVIRLPPIIMNS